MSNPVTKNKKGDPLRQLKDILLVEDQERIRNLESELEGLRANLRDKEKLIETLSPVIGLVIDKKIHDSKTEMANALAPIMGEAIRKQIEKSKDDVVDALYPVIGSTIRKSMREAIKQLAATVNEKVERALSTGLLFKKLKSKISGVPTGDIVLQQSMPFTVHEIFYIHKKSGILLCHYSHEQKSSAGHQDLISGMLSAIRDFAKTAFSATDVRDLSEIQYEDLQIILEDGRHAYLAAVVSGLEPTDFKAALQHLRDDLHKQFHKDLRAFDGDVSRFEKIPDDMRQTFDAFLISDDDPSVAQINHKPRGLFYLAGIVVFIASVLILLFYLPPKLAERRIRNAVEKIQQVNPVFERAGLNLEIDGRKITIRGSAPDMEVKTEVLARLSGLPEVETITDEIKLAPPQLDIEQLQQQVRAAFAAYPETQVSEIQFVIQNDVLFIEGPVQSSREKILLGNTVAKLTAYPIIINNTSLKTQEQAQLPDRSIEKTIFFFGMGSTELQSQDLAQFDNFAQHLQALSFKKLYVIGHSDSQGSPAENKRISEERAQNIIDRLVRKDIDPAKLVLVAEGHNNPLAANDSPQNRARNRRVEFKLQ